MMESKKSYFYKGDIVRETKPSWGRWGVSGLIAVIENVRFNNTTWTIHYRPWYNWIKHLLVKINLVKINYRDI